MTLLEWIGLKGGDLRHEHRLRFVCPELHLPVDCRIVQDVRTGQWKRIEACSAFPEPTNVNCARECTRLMNLGFPLRPVPPA